MGDFEKKINFQPDPTSNGKGTPKIGGPADVSKSAGKPTYDATKKIPSKFPRGDVSKKR